MSDVFRLDVIASGPIYPWIIAMIVWGHYVEKYCRKYCQQEVIGDKLVFLGGPPQISIGRMWMKSPNKIDL